MSGLAFGMAACGSTPVDAKQLFNAGVQSVVSTPSLHFHIESSELPASSSSSFLAGGDGDVRRPSSFVGSLKVNVDGLLLPLQVVATGGKFWIMRPFSSTWEEVNPQQYGLNDPALLLDPHSGLTGLLSAAGSPTFTGKDRFNGKELDEIQVNVSGSKVAELLPGGNPSATDQVTLGIADSGHQLRRLVIRGQVVTKTDTSVYTLIFTNYGENLTVTPPA